MSGVSPSGYTLIEIRDSFNNLRTSYESGRMDHCTNYIPIRLVTLIEQFCRVVHKQGQAKYDWDYRPVSLPILVDVFQRFKPDIKDCEFKIRMYRTHAGSQTGTDDVIRLRSDDDVCNLVESVLSEPNQEVFEWIRLYMLSFQSLKSIKDELEVSFPQLMNVECNKLFSIRHAVAHTMSDHQVSRSMFVMVDSLLHMIESLQKRSYAVADR